MTESDSPARFTRLAVSCGGTGGHFFPGLTVGKTFHEQGGEVCFLLGGKHAQTQIEIVRKANMAALPISAAPPGANPFNWLRIANGFTQARTALRQFKPDALLAMGSFAGFPIIMAARSLHIPIVLHDGNALIGRANALLSAFSERLLAAYPVKNEQAVKCPIQVVGMPIRAELLQQRTIERVAALEKLNAAYQTDFSPERTTLLIFGGSLGAAWFNSTFAQALRAYDARHPDTFQVIHLFGKSTEADRAVYPDTLRHLCLESTPDMGLLYACADRVVCRAGGSTLAELTAFGKTGLIVPFPFAKDDHQYVNTEAIREHNAADVIREETLDDESIFLWLKRAAADSEEWRTRAAGMKQLSRPDAAQDCLRAIADIVHAKQNPVR